MKFSVLEFLKKNSLKICNDAKKISNDNCFQTHLVVIVMVFQRYFLVCLVFHFFFFLVEQLHHKYTQLFIWLLLALT